VAGERELKTPSDYLGAMADAAQDHHRSCQEVAWDFIELGRVEPHLAGPLESSALHVEIARQAWMFVERELRRAAVLALGDRPVNPKAGEALMAMTAQKDRPS
jgi:hypothetical protein